MQFQQLTGIVASMGLNIKKHNKMIGEIYLDKKRSMLPYFISAIAFIVLAVLVIVSISASNNYVAKVGREKITVEEYNFFLKETKENMLYEARQTDSNVNESTFWDTKINGENALDIARKKALDTAVETKIQVIKARENNIKPDNSRFKALDESIKAYIKSHSNRIKADKAARQDYGAGLDALKRIYRQLIIASEFKNATLSKVDWQAQIDKYYEQDKSLFVETTFRQKDEEAVWARHILIKFPEGVKEEDKDKLTKKAEEILTKAKNGEDFAQLAKQYSEDPGSAEYGGDYVFQKGKMVKAFEDAAFSLQPGQISGIIETDFGFHIIKVEEKIEKGQPVSLRCAKEYREFTDKVKNKYFEDLMDSWKKDAKYAVKENKNVLNKIK